MSSPDLTAPPGSSSASTTSTDQPASARTFAATSPLCPAPMTTASCIRAQVPSTVWRETVEAMDLHVAENDIVIDASREQVFAVLADGPRYHEWVMGAADVRAADVEWPAPGARIHHSTGVGPLTIDDSTEVVECEPPT